MAQNTDKISYEDDYYKGLARPYFFGILNKIIEYGQLAREEGLIFDFGAGQGYLKKSLPGRNVVGYDIIPALSDVKDYRDLKPSVIVCSGVLEHLYPADILKLLQEFKQMNPKAPLIVFLPTENWVSRLGMIVTGQMNAHADHVTTYKAANNYIEQYYKPVKRCYFFLGMAQITRYEPL